MYGGPVELEASCDSLGNVTVDLARSVAAILENYFSGREKKQAKRGERHVT